MARTIDRDRHHLTDVLRAAATHEGAALVEIYQNCPVFNDGAFSRADREGDQGRQPDPARGGPADPLRRRERARRGRGARRRPRDRGRGRRRRGRADRPRPDAAGPGPRVLAGAARRQPDRADADRDLPRGRAPVYGRSGPCARPRPPRSSWRTCCSARTAGPSTELLNAVATLRSMRDLDVELLWWEGCPSTERALGAVREALTDLGLDACRGADARDPHRRRRRGGRIRRVADDPDRRRRPGPGRRRRADRPQLPGVPPARRPDQPDSRS